MQRTKTKVDNLLLKNRLMSISTVKEELKINKNSSLIRFLLQYLLNSLNEINFSTEIHEVRELYKILNYIKPENDEEFKIIEKFIAEIIQVIHQKIKLFKEDNIMYSFFKDFEEYLNIYVIETKLSLISKKDGKLPIISEGKLKKIICDLIFKYKNYEYLNIILKNYPNCFNIKVSNKTIVIKLLNAYLKKTKNRDYLERVITLFISAKNYEITDAEKEMIISMCNSAIESKKLNARELLFIKELLCSLKKEKELTEEERVKNLEEYYGFVVIEAKKRLRNNPKHVVDLTDRPIITIDSNGAQLLDDALSFRQNSDGTYELGIYITDLTAIKPNSLYDKQALNRFTSLYFDDQVAPMLPEKLTQNRFSLKQGKHIVMAFTFTFTSKYELIDCQIEKARIDVSNNLSYLDVSNLLENSDNELYPMVKCLLEISEAISDTYGSIDRYHSIKQIARELGGACSEIPKKFMETPGHRIVSANMIFLNHSIAKYFDEHKLPFIYCNGELDDQFPIHDLIAKFSEDKQVKTMLKSIATVYKPSTFSDVNIGHKGLGLDAYGKITSPARSYVSLYLQRLLYDLFILKMPLEEYIKKYSDVPEKAKTFTLLQQRNREYSIEYTKLKRRIGLDKN